MSSKEQLEQVYGLEVDTSPAAVPDGSIPMKGKYVTLTPWKHDYVPGLWQYMKVDPMLTAHMIGNEINNESDLRKSIEEMEQTSDVLCYAVMADPKRLNPDPAAAAASTDVRSHVDVVGVVFLGNFETDNRVAEIGAIFTPVLQRTAAATEIHYLLLKQVLDQDSPALDGTSPPYRRIEWRCNHLNLKSRASALRAGYIFEGTYRQKKIVKRRTRDEDMLSMLDKEWPLNKAAFERWLANDNWDASGKQLKKLQEIRTELDVNRS